MKKLKGPKRSLDEIEEIVILPAYGRKYSSFIDIKEDWESGKDFTIDMITPFVKTGTYINKADVLRYSPQATVRVLYFGNTGVLYDGGKHEHN